MTQFALGIPEVPPFTRPLTVLWKLLVSLRSVLECRTCVSLAQDIRPELRSTRAGSLTICRIRLANVQTGTWRIPSLLGLWMLGKFLAISKLPAATLLRGSAVLGNVFRRAMFATERRIVKTEVMRTLLRSASLFHQVPLYH